MEIKYLGSQTVLIKTKKESVIINPEKGGDKIESRIVVFSDKKFDYMGLDGEKVIVRGPGEYEVGGIEIKGWAVDEKMIYLLESEGVIVGFLGEMDEMLTDKMIERISGIDVLVASVGGKIGGKSLQDLAKKWGANYLVPVGYKADDATIKKFLDEVDEEGLESIDSLKIDRDNLPDGLEITLLKC